jgi:hypothetical protein
MPRRFQFSLKWLFVAMLVVAAFFGGMVAQRGISGFQATKREIELKEALREVRGELRWWVGEGNRLQQAMEQKESESRPKEKRYIKGWPVPKPSE